MSPTFLRKRRTVEFGFPPFRPSEIRFPGHSFENALIDFVKLIPVKAYEKRKTLIDYEVKGQGHGDLLKFLRGGGSGALLLLIENSYI